VVLLGVVRVAVALCNGSDEQEFQDWMRRYSKVYDTSAEYRNRCQIYHKNKQHVAHLNSLSKSVVHGMSKFSDLSKDEYLRVIQSKASMSSRKVHQPSFNIAAKQNWTTCAGEVSDQADFATIFYAAIAIECALVNSGQPYVSLSKQQLLDCTPGASPSAQDYFTGIAKLGGIESDADYPWTGQQEPCQFNPQDVAATIAGYKNVTDENDLMTQVSKGPVLAAVDADSWQFYDSGIFTGPCGSNLDLEVLVVGYGSQGGIDYWMIQNSWGPEWGEDGYILLERGSNLCGIASDACYPVGVQS